MRNGINVAAVSELVHEIRHVDGENEIHYGVELQWCGGLSMQLNTRALTFGSKRIARNFHFKTDHHSNPSPNAAPSPTDLFLCGVSACVANILVQGASYKAINIQSLKVLSRGKTTTSGEAITGIADGSVIVKLAADGNRWQYKQMMLNVSRFSPNYVTATRKNNITLNYSHQEMSLRKGSLFSNATTITSTYQSSDNNDYLDTGIEISWRDGTQFAVSLLDRQCRDESWSLDSSFSVDQPNAALGLNKDPNPQEYILGAIAADVAQQLVLITQEDGHSLSNLSAYITCKLDMQGCFNIFDKSAVQLQNTVLNMSAMSDYSESEMQTFIELACQRSSCWQSFINPCKIQLDREDV